MTMPPLESAWFRGHRLNPQARLRLFCWSYAGAGASVFRQWPGRLAALADVLPVQLPGRENRLHQAPFAHLDALIEALGEALTPYLDKPFVFFGYSMGALISFELARYLRRKGLPEPCHLCIAAHRAPHLPGRFPTIHHLPEEEFLCALRDLAGTPEEILRHPEARDLFLPTLRADFALCETYTYVREPPLAASLCALAGSMDETVTRQEIEAWQEHTRGAFLVQQFPGTHFFLHSTEGQILSTVAQILRWLLEQAPC